MAATQTIRLLLPCPRRTSNRVWGDYYFGHSLGDALARRGYRICYSYAPRTLAHRLMTFMSRLRNRNEIEIVIRGKKVWGRLTFKTSLIWVISQASSLRADELGSFDHVFVASPQHLDKIQGDCKSASLLYQCTDAQRFFPKRKTETSETVFVGNRRANAPRDVVLRLVEQGLNIAVWGQGWKDLLPASVYRGVHIENDVLAETYSNASVVLNDHNADMRENGFVSNRVYDVLACGTPIVTEDMAGIPPDLSEHVDLYSDDQDVRPAIEHAQQRPRAPLEKISRHVRENHSFDARAKSISNVIESLTDALSPRQSAAV